MEETRKPARKPRATAPRPAAKKAAPPRGTTVRKSVGTRSRAAVAAAPAAGREDMVRTAAYYRAERRGFAPGFEWEDWLAAEAELAALADPRAAPKPRKAPARKPRAG